MGWYIFEAFIYLLIFSPPHVFIFPCRLWIIYPSVSHSLNFAGFLPVAF